jgi:hypothetical protein
MIADPADGVDGARQRPDELAPRSSAAPGRAWEDERLDRPGQRR